MNLQLSTTTIPRFLAATVLVLASCLGTTAAAQDNADADSKAVDQLVRKTVGEVLTVLKSTSPIDSKRQQVVRTIDPIVDYKLMARNAITGARWKKLGADEKKKFADLFQQTLRWVYFEKLDTFTDEVVEFEPPKQLSKSKYEVMSYIVSKGDRIKVSYKLWKSSRTKVWRVYDFEIEGVSITKSYRSQYSEFLRENTLDKLLVKMQEKIDAYKAGDQKESKGTKASNEDKGNNEGGQKATEKAAEKAVPDKKSKAE